MRAMTDCMNNELKIGEIYKATWIVLGCPRTAFFKVLGFAKNGNAKGLYLGAGETKWVKHSVKPEHFGRYSKTSL